MLKSSLSLFAVLLLAGCPTEAPKPTTPVAKKAPVAAASAPASAPARVAPKPKPMPPAVPPPTTGVEMKVADVFAQKDTIGDKGVKLQGKVVKFNANIMGSNWLHVQDGSGTKGTNDIVVTTKSVVAVGDMVEVIGRVSRSRDFGAGYKFDVILENATVTKK